MSYAAKNPFIKFFDNSPDAETISLEVSPLESFQNLFEMMQETDSHDSYILLQLVQLQHGNPDELEPIEESQQTLFDLIRNVWDIAYSHGYHDAQADDGKPLSKIEE